jgi:hypothetical protein
MKRRLVLGLHCRINTNEANCRTLNMVWEGSEKFVHLGIPRNVFGIGRIYFSWSAT